MINELINELAKNFSNKKEHIIKDELIRFLKEGLVYIEETEVESYLNVGELNLSGALRLRIKNDDYILKLEKENEELKKIKDHCEKCGCNEFLCGHNARE